MKPMRASDLEMSDVAEFERDSGAAELVPGTMQVAARVLSGRGALQRVLAEEQHRLLRQGADWDAAFADVQNMSFCWVHPCFDKKGRRILAVLGQNLVTALRAGSEAAVTAATESTSEICGETVEEGESLGLFEKTLLFGLFLVQAIAKDSFVVVHINDGMEGITQEYLRWLHSFYKLLPHAHLKTLKKVLVLTSSRKLRSRLWLAKPFTSGRIWKKLEFVHSTSKLVDKLGCVLNLPECPLDLDSPSSCSTVDGKDTLRQSQSPSSQRSAMLSQALRFSLADLKEDSSKFESCVGDASQIWRGHRKSLSLLSASSSNGTDSCCSFKSARVRTEFDRNRTYRSSGSVGEAEDYSDGDDDDDYSVGGVFGAPLSLVMELPGSELIPQVLEESVAYLLRSGEGQEGLFRVPGDEKIISRLKNMYNKNKIGAPVIEHLAETLEINAFDVGSLLKAFFRELPQPIIPAALYFEVMQLLKQENDVSTLAYQLSDRMLGMPQRNLDVLGFLIHFLSFIAKNWSFESRMDRKNIAIVWAPNILIRPSTQMENEGASTEGSTQAGLQMLADLPLQVKAVLCMIEHPKIVFPGEMLSKLPPLPPNQYDQNDEPKKIP